MKKDDPNHPAKAAKVKRGENERRWDRLLELHDQGKPWIGAFMEIYPEYDHHSAIAKLRHLRYYNKTFQRFLKKRGTKLGLEAKMPKTEVLQRLADISRFNLADMYTQLEDGTIQLKENWLELAKEHNVLKRITITKTTKESRSGEKFTTEIIDITPYSSDAALSKISAVLGYVKDKTPGNMLTVQNMNLNMTEQIDRIREAVNNPQKALPQPVIDVTPEFVDRMMKAKIEKTVNGAEDQG